MNKILIILSGSDHITLDSGKVIETGFFLKELAQPLQALVDAGYEIVFANPNGKEPHMDPFSNHYVWYGFNINEYNREIELLDRMKKERNFLNPRTFSSLTNKELEGFSGCFIPGGHAPMTDLSDDAELGRILTFFHENHKPIASICHGPVAFLSTKKVGEFAFKDYKMTCYSNAEEKTNEYMWWDSLKDKLETMLRDNGASMNLAWPMGAKVTRDRELITAQNPNSAFQLGQEFVSMLGGSA
jgi:putative intracellular protease/amidase